MKYKIAICDDQTVDQEYIAGIVREWATTQGIMVQLNTFSSAEAFLFQYEEEKDYDIIILDIEMDKMDGVTLAKKLRENNDHIQLFFVTGYPDFIAEGYEVEALHYLMKPVNREKCFKVLDKAVQNLSKATEVIFLQKNGETLLCPIRDIYYVEVFSHVCVLHGKDGTFEEKMSISELEDKLGESFVRTHRSFLVNLARIRRIAKTEISMEDGSIVPLARRKYTEVNQAFIRYFQSQNDMV